MLEISEGDRNLWIREKPLGYEKVDRLSLATTFPTERQAEIMQSWIEEETTIVELLQKSKS